ncbi:hypothetical protein E2C01_012898 [Portunus trituberculatus]|uniref:Secreted protein n=1 Tax=Portunus trituberculatus TaxID=210409 RepID=A0A5B7DFN5_PORTR|nr:hypothetical protein [Portunus trituberculatus]
MLLKRLTPETLLILTLMICRALSATNLTICHSISMKTETDSHCSPLHTSQQHLFILVQFLQPEGRTIDGHQVEEMTSHLTTTHTRRGLPHHVEFEPQLYGVFTSHACFSFTALVVAVNGGNTHLVHLLIDGGSDSLYKGSR